MADFLKIGNLGNLLMLCFLQAVLGFDNLLYISIEGQRAPVASQKAVRFWGIIIAVALRVVLLFVMIQLIDALAEPFFIMNWDGVLTGGVNFATCVFLVGDIFIMYTAVKEISHLLTVGGSYGLRQIRFKRTPVRAARWKASTCPIGHSMPLPKVPIAANGAGIIRRPEQYA